MRLTLWSGLLWAALLVGVVRMTSAQTLPSEASKVNKIEIKHVGPQSVSDDLVRANIRVKVGDTYSLGAVDEDVRNLYATGFFYNIRVTEDQSAGAVALTYLVQGKLKLMDIKFSGNKNYSEAKLRKKVTVKVGEPLDEHRLFNDVQEIKKLYQKGGYPETKVEYRLRDIEEEAGRGAVTFEITESPKVKIQAVEFMGATAFPQKKLRKVIKTRQHWMFSWITGSGKLKAEQLEDDREKLVEFYRDRGYIDFELTDVKFESPTPDRMIIKFFITEGRPYKVGAVTFKGTTMLLTNAVRPEFKSEAKPTPGADRRAFADARILNRNFTMKEGDVFTPKGLNKDITAVEDFYGAKGHIDVAEGSANLMVQKIPNTEKNTMDLQFDVDEGQKSFIEKIEIRGNTKTKDKVIRRELAVSPGETFDMVKIKISKARLEQMQYFEKVEAKPEPTDVPNRKNLVIGLEEKNTGNLTVGAGFSSIDNLVGFADISQGNFDLFNPPTFTGGGQKARLHFALGTQRRDVVLSFIEPWFLGRKLQLGVDLFHHQLDYVSLYSLYNEQRTGGRVGLTKDLWQNRLIGSVSYTLQDVGIIDVVTGAPPAVVSEEGHSLLSTFGASIAYDTRNNALIPDKGQRTELTGEITGGLLGSKNYYKLELRTAWYFKGFAAGHVLEVLGRTGVAEHFGSTADVPFYDRYYLGGQDTLRGYKYRDIGPKQYDGNKNLEPVGGDTYWFGSLEYSVPIIERVRLAAFYDIGMVYPNAFSYRPVPSLGAGGLGNYDSGTYADNWGIGIRLNLPIGPLRLDYGLPLTHDKSVSGSGRFQFGVGYTREFR